MAVGHYLSDCLQRQNATAFVASPLDIMSFVSQSSQGSQFKRSRSASRSRSRSRAPAGATFGTTNSVMSQGGVPGGGVVRLIKSIPSVEVKSRLQSITTAGTPNLWTQIDPGDLLSGIIQGTAPSERIGRKIRVIGVIVRIPFAVPTGCWTIDLVRDKQCNGVAAGAAIIYSAQEWGSPPNNLYEERFQFMKRQESVNFGQQTPTQDPSLTGISYQKKCNFVVEYNGTTGTVTDLVSDNLMVWSNHSSPAGSLTPILRGYVRVLFVDA